MNDVETLMIGLAVALGLGLLIGADRERRKGDGPSRAAAGLRTFAIAALMGGVSLAAGGVALLATATAGVILLAALSYWRAPADDPGLTTEIALVLTTLLGALAMTQPLLAGGLGVLVAGLLHARSPLHRFVRSVLSEEDVRDALILAGATLVVLPLLPDTPVGPFGALDLRRLWTIVILVMSVSALGYVMIRVAGAQYGLPVAGLASGFISSLATIAAMGERVAKTPDLKRSAVAGAVLSTVATIVQMAIVLAVISAAALEALWVSLLCAGAAALLYGALFTLRALQQEARSTHQPGRAISVPSALVFAAILGAVSVASAALQHWFGTAGTIVAASVGGLADSHAAAASVASLVAAGTIEAADAVVPILAALSTNTVMKIVVALRGGRAFALAVIPGIVLVAAAAWAGMLLS